MSYFNRVLTFFKKKAEAPEPELVGDENCPFCWGYQEYDDKTRLLTKDKQIDVKNHKDKYVKVGKFMVEHVDGFKNKNESLNVAPNVVANI